MAVVPEEFQRPSPEGATGPGSVKGPDGKWRSIDGEWLWDGTAWVPNRPGPGPQSGLASASKEVRGRTGTVVFDGQFVTIIRKGFLARSTIGKGEKRIPLASISAVQFKPAGPVVNGYIEFTLPGGNENRSRFGAATKDAGHNENAVVFTKQQMPRFMALRAEVEAAIAARHTPVTLQARPGIPEQIAQLAALRDQGLLTEDEFQSKKTELLGRI